MEQDAGYILSNNLQDRSFRSGLRLAGWNPGTDMEAKAVEWWEFDFEYGSTPVGRFQRPARICGLSETGNKLSRICHRQLRELFSILRPFTTADSSQNTTFYQYSEANNYVFDSRGFNAFIQYEASTFLTANDPRLLLNTVVTNVSYSNKGVTVYNKDGSCVHADYAICTFS